MSEQARACRHNSLHAWACLCTCVTRGDGWVTRWRMGEREGEMGRWGRERERWDDAHNRARCAVAEHVGWAREGEVLSPSSRVAGWAREGASEGEGREREKTGVGMSVVLGKVRSPRGGGRGRRCMLSNGRSAVVLPSTWHYRCCIIVVGWTWECMSMRQDEMAQCAQFMRMLHCWVGDGEGEGRGRC